MVSPGLTPLRPQRQKSPSGCHLPISIRASGEQGLTVHTKPLKKPQTPQAHYSLPFTQPGSLLFSSLSATLHSLPLETLPHLSSRHVIKIRSDHSLSILSPQKAASTPVLPSCVDGKNVWNLPAPISPSFQILLQVFPFPLSLICFWTDIFLLTYKCVQISHKCKRILP